MKARLVLGIVLLGIFWSAWQAGLVGEAYHLLGWDAEITFKSLINKADFSAPTIGVGLGVFFIILYIIDRNTHNHLRNSGGKRY